MRTEKDRYAVVGNPIGHSQSPSIHAQFAEQTQQNMAYEAICAPLEQFSETVAAFWAQGGKGLNVTVPFKQQAFNLAHSMDALADSAGAVNTLLYQDGQIHGYNTDGIGLVQDLHHHQAPLTDCTVLLLGAGGAARGAVLPLLQEQPKRLVIANRTAAKAAHLAQRFRPHGNVTGTGFTDLHGHFDLIINATSAGLSQQVPAISAQLVHAECVGYDMMYGHEPTAFVDWMRQCGAQAAFDGLGMLVRQAAESFRLWRGVTPDVAAVLARLRGV